MVRAMDESVKNITQTYQELGLIQDALIVLTTDNGGIPGDGGSNYPREHFLEPLCPVLCRSLSPACFFCARFSAREQGHGV